MDFKVVQKIFLQYIKLKVLVYDISIMNIILIIR